MPDWGLKISDAAGNLHDLAKNAFDSLSVDARAPLNFTEKALNQSFSTTFTALKSKAMKNLGLELTGNLTIENMSSLVMEKVLEAGGKLAGEVIVWPRYCHRGGRRTTRHVTVGSCNVSNWRVRRRTGS